MSLTKIVVVKRKRLILIGAAAIAILLLLIIIIAAMRNKEDSSNAIETEETAKIYTAGVYTKLVSIGDSILNMEVVLDEDHINAVAMQNMNEIVTTMYPLISPSLEAIEKQLINGIPLSEVDISGESMYTQSLLLEAIGDILSQASTKP